MSHKTINPPSPNTRSPDSIGLFLKSSVCPHSLKFIPLEEGIEDAGLDDGDGVEVLAHDGVFCCCALAACWARFIISP